MWDIGNKATYVDFRGERVCCVVIDVDGSELTLKVTARKSRVWPKGYVLERSKNFVYHRD